MELEFVASLHGRLPTHPAVRVGPGDDAAVLATDGRELVVTTDSVADGTHFVLGRDAPEAVGRKALAVNLSDLAAMAAEPVAAFVALTLPRADDPLSLARRLYEGMAPLAASFGCALAGGDTNAWDGPLVIAVTAIGRVGPRGPLLRSGARFGDAVLVTGRLGGSLAGRHMAFTPRCKEALLLHSGYGLSAGMDLSDGLSLDASRLAAASGVGLELDSAAIPVADDALAAAAGGGPSPLERALSDGEDFELLFTAPEDVASRVLADQPVACGVTRIGAVVASPGLWLRTPGGEPQPLEPRGYVHG